MKNNGVLVSIIPLHSLTLMARVVCECGSDILSSYLKKHMQTQVHLRFVENKQRGSGRLVESSRLVAAIEFDFEPGRIEQPARRVGRPRAAERKVERQVEISLDQVDMDEQRQLFEFYEKKKRGRIEDQSHHDRHERYQRLQRARNVKEFEEERWRIHRNRDKREQERRRLEEERLRLEQERIRIELKKQERITRRRQEEERLEQERVAKRGIPKHIVAIVLDHSKEASCSICFDELTIENTFMTKCGHMMCKSCERKLFEQQNNLCPTCRHDF